MTSTLAEFAAPTFGDRLRDAGQRMVSAVLWLREAPKLTTAVVLFSLMLAVFGETLAPHSPTAVDPRNGSAPPAFMEGGSWSNVLGTDRLGRDILSRVMVGARTSLAVAFISIAIAGTIGSTLGLIAGYRGGWVDSVVMRTVDGTLAFPSILLALILATVVGPSFWVVVTVIAFIVWARYARLVRGETLAVKGSGFVSLAMIAGASDRYIIFRHILPMVFNSIVVLSSLQVGWGILVEGSLSFLGAGVPPPSPTWGGMVAEGRSYIETTWWISAFPGLAIMLVVLAFNIFGDWLRDILDPKLRQL